ncbi:flagellar sheath protein A [Vibrio campbellii]|uniref:flagellar sheath protein A n=1 Tax=Vibrio campbellii TaxID=680 RepID=UPI001BDAE90C|nr:flagellar sheath protein A [Vibrio campbellii]MBT0339838.1 flagellar sheath protein A [Vibrio campbellii]
MKQLKVLPLVAIISGLMVGCGGGGGGGGGAPTDYVTLTFVQKAKTIVDKSATCTIFDKVQQNGVTTYTYARKASDVTVYVHDSKGSIIDTMHPDVNGVLTIDKYPLEEKSYVTFIDSPSDSDPFYKALSIQEELLESQLIQVNRPQVDHCYAGDVNPVIQKGYILASTQNAQADSYQFLSSLEEENTVSSNLKEVEKLGDESVLVKGIINGKLSGYEFVNQLGTESVPSIAILERVDTDLNWSNLLVPASELESLDISLSKGVYTYSWDKPNVLTEEAFPISSIERNYHYQASGTLTTGWGFKTVGEVSGYLDVKMPDSLRTYDVQPSIVNTGLNGVVQATGVDSTHELILRAKYTQSVNTPTIKTLEHVIIGKPTSGQLVIPDLTQTGLSSANPESLSLDAYEYANLSEAQVQNILSQYENEDTVAIVVKPSQRAKHGTDIRSLEYTKLSR